MGITLARAWLVMLVGPAEVERPGELAGDGVRSEVTPLVPKPGQGAPVARSRAISLASPVALMIRWAQGPLALGTA